VYEQVRDRLDLAFEDLGEQNVKNIDRSIRAWTWTASMGGATVKIPAGGTFSPLPDKPSIAVLPFDNMSGDPEQEYFADGIAEDVITALARMRGLFVVARNSSFSYRGQSPDIRQVGRELGVRYVLEGSVRRAGQRVRITAQLIDAETGRHIWAERYDRSLDDIFEVQDEITVSVTGTVGSEISAAESERAATLRIEDLTAWDRGAKALWYLHKTTAEGTAEALKICLEEIERSGGNSQIHALLSLGYVYNLIYAWGEQAPADVAVQAARAGRSAIDLDAKNELAHTLLACVLWTTGNHDAAIREAEIAVDLNPNLPLAHVQHGASLGFSGAEHHAKAQDCFERAIRLAPRDIWVCWPYAIWACLDTVAGRYDAAIEHAREALGHFPRLGLAHRTLAFALALSGQLDEAKAAWAQAIEIQPVDPALYAEALRRMFKLENEAERLIEAMRLVGARVE
jgi:adenylate cyclase